MNCRPVIPASGFRMRESQNSAPGPTSEVAGAVFGSWSHSELACNRLPRKDSIWRRKFASSHEVGTIQYLGNVWAPTSRNAKERSQDAIMLLTSTVRNSLVAERQHSSGSRNKNRY